MRRRIRPARKPTGARFHFPLPSVPEGRAETCGRRLFARFPEERHRAKVDETFSSRRVEGTRVRVYFSPQ